MKKHTHFFTVIGLIALMFSTPAFGQGYQSFFGEKTTKYSICSNQTVFCGENDTITPNNRLLGCKTTGYSISKEDTIMVNDTVYYQASQGAGWESFEWEWKWWDYGKINLFIREDTFTGQIFRYIKENKKEYLVCDMSLNIGDTFTFPYHEYGYYYEAGKDIIVDSIDYINGKKIIYFQDFNASSFYGIDYGDYYRQFFHLTFIEGIGPTYGPFGYIFKYGQEPYLGVMLCVAKDDTLIHITSPYLGCYQIEYSSIAKIETNPLRVYPNPATDNIHIEIDNEALLYGTLRIIDPIGQVVFTRVLTSNKEIIPIGHLSAGLYIIHYNINNQVFHSKIVKY